MNVSHDATAFAMLHTALPLELDDTEDSREGVTLTDPANAHWATFPSTVGSETNTADNVLALVEIISGNKFSEENKME